VVVHFKSGLNGKTIHRSRIGQKVEFQLATTVFRRRPQQFARHHHRRFAMKLNDLRDRFRVPPAQLLDYYTRSVLFAAL
jgi:hypothetical protein